jgi:hypothetical protein
LSYWKCVVMSIKIISIYLGKAQRIVDAMSNAAICAYQDCNYDSKKQTITAWNRGDKANSRTEPIDFWLDRDKVNAIHKSRLKSN